MSIDANDILMGGGGAPTAKFDVPGATHGGRIVSKPRSHQLRTFDPKNPGGGEPRFFPSGDPIMGITVDVQTQLRDSAEDDGVRRIYLESQEQIKAVREAVKNAGAPGLEVGGELTVTYTHSEIPGDPRSKKFYTARYVSAANTSLMADTPPPAPAAAQTISNGGPASAPAAAVTPAAAPVNGGVDQAALLAALGNLNPQVIAALQAQGGQQ